MTRNQHCLHFEPSLVQGRVVIWPTPQPSALLTPTPDWQPDGQGAAADAFQEHTPACRTCRDRGRLDPHCPPPSFHEECQPCCRDAQGHAGEATCGRMLSQFMKP